MEKFEKNKNRAKNFVMEIIFGFIYIIYLIFINILVFLSQTID